MMRHVEVVLLLAVWAFVGLPCSAATQYVVYRVVPDDTVQTVAARYGISPEELRETNPHLGDGDLTVGGLITVPVLSSSSAANKAVAGAGQESVSGRLANGINQGVSIRQALGPKRVGPDGQRESTAPLAGGSGSREAIGDNGAAGVQGAGGPLSVTAALNTPLQKSFAVNGAVGRLAVVASNDTPIRREHDEQAPLVYKAGRDAKLVVVSQYADWFGVLMVDRTTCWVETQYVSLTNTELVPGGTHAAQVSTSGQKIIEAAYRYLGVPYLWGGNGFGGIDCSGLVLQCYRTVGLNLPRVSREQFQVGSAVAWNELQPGDRLYFASDGRRIDHTGLYVGNGQFIHASGRRRMVAVDNLFTPSYWNMFVGARR